MFVRKYKAIVKIILDFEDFRGFRGILRNSGSWLVRSLTAEHCLLETVTDSVVTQEFRERGISVCTTSSENVSTTKMQNNF